MPQPNKKRKTTEEIDLQTTTRDVIGKLAVTLDELEESDPKHATPLLSEASLSLLKLKAMQRRLLDHVHESQRTLQLQRQKRDEQELVLENLKYQKLLNDHAIDTSQKLDISNLVRLCRSEMGDEVCKDLDDDTVLQQFFRVDIKDPVKRAVIVDKLNKQIRTRKKLEGLLAKQQRTASNLEKSLATKRKLLQSLPSKLKEVERATIPLQNFCRKSLNASKLLGTSRRTNLDLAYSLPKPLYTLYYLLQTSLDGLENTNGDVNSMEDNDEATPSLEVNKDSSQVVLSIPIPTISDRVGTINTTTIGFGNVKKVVSIFFSYDATVNQVFAECSLDHDMGNLLTEVFPGDTGEPTDSFQKNDNVETEELHTRLGGRSYNWCNYIAGLHLPPSSQVSQPEMHRSASVVVRTLIQRVRAQATLSWILHALSRKPHPLPVHPAMKDAPFCHPKESHVKLVQWTEDSNASEEESSIDFYLATLKRRSSTLTLRVGIYSACYPSVPPTWELNPEQHDGDHCLDGDKSTLYDEQLATLERRINQDVEQLVLTSDDTTYEWILAHQLSEIASKWDQQQTDVEST